MVNLIIHLYRFSQALPKYTKDDEVLLSQIPENLRGEVQLRTKRILHSGIGGWVIAWAVPMITAIISLVKHDAPETNGPLETFIPFIIAGPLLFFLGIFSGTSFGILKTPDWFMTTPFGVRWLRLTGVGTPRQAKVVCFIFILFGIVITGFASFAAWMIPQGSG